MPRKNVNSAAEHARILRFQRFPRLGVCLLALLAAGCFRLETTLTIAPDGSGKAVVYASIRQQALDRMLLAQSLTAELRGETASNAFSVASAPWLKIVNARDGDQARRFLLAYATPTLEFQRISLDIRQDRRDVFFEIQFRSLEDLARCPLFDPLTWEVQSKSDGAIHCTLFFPPVELGSEFTSLPADLTPLLADLNILFTIQTPSEILETTGHRSSTRTARWQFNYDRDPRDIRRIDRAALQVVFASTGHSFPLISNTPRAKFPSRKAPADKMPR